MCRSFFMLNKINFGHVLKMWDFGKRYFTATMTEGKKKEKKKPNDAPQRPSKSKLILKKIFSFRSFSLLCGCACLLEWRRFFSRYNFKSDYKLVYWWIHLGAKLKMWKCPKTLRRKGSRRKSIKRNAIWTSSFSGQYFKI